MNTKHKTNGPGFGADDLRLPDDIREPVLMHLRDLREKYLQRDWAGRVGFGKRPALIVIDMAKFWLHPTMQMGSNLDPVIQSCCRVLSAARAAGIPIFFTTYAYDPANPPSPHDRKLKMRIPADSSDLFEIDPRLERRPTEKIVYKRYASSFKGTNLHELLANVEADTLIVTGISTSHCVYATCRDATDSVRVIVPQEAVGERCEIMHEVNLLDIDIDLADVMPEKDVIEYLRGLQADS